MGFGFFVCLFVTWVFWEGFGIDFFFFWGGVFKNVISIMECLIILFFFVVFCVWCFLILLSPET